MKKNEITKDMFKIADKFNCIDWNDDVQIEDYHVAGCKGGYTVILSAPGKRWEKSIPNDRLYFLGFYYRNKEGNDMFLANPLRYSDINNLFKLLTDNLHSDNVRWKECSNIIRTQLSAMKLDKDQRERIIKQIQAESRTNIDRWL
jgi:hypothetical protein